MGGGIEQQGSVTTASERFERAAERVFGGWSLIIEGVLLFGAQLLIALLPAPRAARPGLALWVHEFAFPLSMSDELLFFAIVCLTPGVVVLFRTTRFRRPVSSLLGCSSLLLAMTLLGVLVVVGGRLVYPVFDISLSDDAIALVVSLFFGGLHSALLFIGVGLIAAGFALRQDNAGRRLPIASFGAGALQVSGAYPWLTPAWVNVTTAAAPFAWMRKSTRRAWQSYGNDLGFLGHLWCTCVDEGQGQAAQCGIPCGVVGCLNVDVWLGAVAGAAALADDLAQFDVIADAHHEAAAP